MVCFLRRAFLNYRLTRDLFPERSFLYAVRYGWRLARWGL